MQRRLTAILSADVADYSGLMEADEAGTLERLESQPEAASSILALLPRAERLVKLMGDGALRRVRQRHRCRELRAGDPAGNGGSRAEPQTVGPSRSCSR